MGDGADQLRRGGKVKRGRMGLLPDDASKEVAEANGIGSKARAGLRAGDLILAVDNIEVSSVKQFQAQLAKLDKAKTVSMVVLRADAVTIVLVKPGKP